MTDITSILAERGSGQPGRKASTTARTMGSCERAVAARAAFMLFATLAGTVSSLGVVGTLIGLKDPVVP